MKQSSLTNGGIGIRKMRSECGEGLEALLSENPGSWQRANARNVAQALCTREGISKVSQGEELNIAMESACSLARPVTGRV